MWDGRCWKPLWRLRGGSGLFGQYVHHTDVRGLWPKQRQWHLPERKDVRRWNVRHDSIALLHRAFLWR